MILAVIDRDNRFNINYIGANDNLNIIVINIILSLIFYFLKLSKYNILCITLFTFKYYIYYKIFLQHHY